MAVFEYKAKNMEGALVSGDLDAGSEEALEDALRERGYFVVECRRRLMGAGPGAGAARGGAGLLGGGLLRRVSARDVAVFCRQFSVLLNAGVTIVEAMSVLKGQTESRRLDEVIGQVHEQLQRGSVLSEAMAAHAGVFGEFFINMVKVGEASGNLDSVMARLADYFERDNKISQKVRSAMTYPAVLAVLTCVVITLLMVWVLPMFSDILTQMGGQMPGITRGLMAISSFFARHLLAILAAVAALVLCARAFSRSEGGRLFLDRAKLAVPGVRTLTLKVVTSRFARSMSILLKSGIPIINAVDIIQGMIGNRVLEARFAAASQAIKEGRGIAGPIRDMKCFPNMLVHMVAIGENSGELDEMLGRTAGFFDVEVEEAIERITVMIEPLLIIVLGAVVGLIIGSIMLPMIGIMTSM